MFYMKKRCLKVLSLSILLSTFAFTGCANQIEITFVTDNGTVKRKIDKGSNIETSKIPATPQVQGKYCLWDTVDYTSLTEDTTVNYTCYDTVSSLTTNISQTIDVTVSSEQADLDYIFKDLQITAALEGGQVKSLYKNDYLIHENGYNKDVVGNYRVGLAYNNKEIFINIRVNKIKNYVTAILGSDKGYLNEGLPTISANTTVPGEIKFNDNQTLVIGTKAYDWTFTPTDLDKYEVVHGKSEVSVINATSIVTNKEAEVLTFEYNTTKTDIINYIQEDLIVTGKFGNIYREIDPRYYMIDSEYKAGQAGENIPFTITYDKNLTATIYVNVKKNENYSLTVSDINRLDITSESTLDDVYDIIGSYYESSTDGDFTFADGEELKVGRYTYSYTFKPKNEYFATKTGEIVINTYKIVDIKINESYLPRYDYNAADEEDVISDIKENVIAKFVYNHGEEIDINRDKIEVSLSPLYRKDNPGEYTYTITYDDVNATGSLWVNKRVLVDDVNFIVEAVPGTFDPENLDAMPEFVIINKSHDFDETLFTVIPDLEIDPVKLGEFWLYSVIIEPNEEIADKFESARAGVFIAVD